MRDVFEVVSSDEYLNLVLKLGNKQATARDIALTLAFPDDRAQIYAATEYGVVAERVDCITKISDPRLQTEAFKKRIEQFAERYIGVSYEDVGYINGNTVADPASRIVVIGSSTRVIKKDAEEAPLVELPTDEINIEKAAEVDAAIAYQRELVQQYISTLKELTNKPEVKKALEFEGLTVDFEKVNQTWNEGIGFGTGIDDAIVRPLTERKYLWPYSQPTPFTRFTNPTQ